MGMINHKDSTTQAKAQVYYFNLYLKKINLIEFNYVENACSFNNQLHNLNNIELLIHFPFFIIIHV